MGQLQCRRAFVPGGCWFFTVNLHDRRQRLLVEHIAALRAAVAATRRDYSFTIDAFVVLPDHLHAVWTLRRGDADFSMRWRLIKMRFAKSLPKTEPLTAVQIARRERGVWQNRFWEHLIRDETDYARHIEYCYINPVKHGYVTRVLDWPHSSFYRDVEAGLFPADWQEIATRMVTLANVRERRTQ
ncbi:transposase [Bradyrhizobium sp. IC3195]|nr:transposase [Bradyrhizobium sp. IC3195]